MTFVEIVANVGFPIAVTIYLLTRFEGEIEKLEKAINNLSRKISNNQEDRG
ncbi:YvrJ family protein [Pontibacillus yanchengensis]|nr:YvrJ family protein [Pontibacillus yanchengensis]